jgi:uncharacterized membrane protein HdeD (DUF308 family)
MKAQIPVFINLYRGGAAIVLGILLLFIPNRSGGLLLNLMGFFWLSIGFSALRRTQADERNPGQRTIVIAGFVGILAGIVVITRQFTRQWVDGELIFFVLGIVILATGLLHMFSEYRLGNITSDRLTGAHFFLGLLEVAIGALLLLQPGTNSPFLYWVATAWAFVYGALYVGTAVGEFIKSRREEKS